jgi:hypothetical protein
MALCDLDPVAGGVRSIGAGLSASGHAEQRANDAHPESVSSLKTRTRLASKLAQVLEQQPRRGLSWSAVVVF